MTSVLERAAQIPGVDRRHRPSDFFHERTNFTFMRHRRRILGVFVAIVIVSLTALATLRLNLGIDFEGGVSWQVEMADGKTASVADVRDLLVGSDFVDAKVTTTKSAQENSTTVRVQSEELPNDPIKNLRDVVATATGTKPADVTADIAGTRGTFSVGGVQSPDQARIEQALAKVDGVDAEVAVTPTSDGSNVSVIIEQLPPSPRDEITAALATFAGRSVSEVSINTVGPTWGNEVSKKALYALLLFFVVLAVYLSIRFEFKMAASAIVAVVHDIIFTIGVYAIVGFEVTPATVTAFLTILGFSLYDTVVVFDKVRENVVNVGGRLTYADMVDQSLNQVLMRSLSTSLVALLPVMSLLIIGSLILGATALEEFALALFAGLFVGTYSSIFVAAPMLCSWKEREPQFRAVRDRQARAASSAANRVATKSAFAPASASSVSGGSSASGVVVEQPDEVAVPGWDTTGVPGPPAVGRAIPPRPRQQRRRKRR
jgi:preprotein translocase subunit SecF